MYKIYFINTADNVPATCGVSGTHQSYDDHEAGSSRGQKGGQEHDHELATSFVNTHKCYQQVLNHLFTHKEQQQTSKT
jgi:hypothetical protein